MIRSHTVPIHDNRAVRSNEMIMRWINLRGGVGDRRLCEVDSDVARVWFGDVESRCQPLVVRERECFLASCSPLVVDDCEDDRHDYGGQVFLCQTSLVYTLAHCKVMVA
jgi:hypothetical protein